MNNVPSYLCVFLGICILGMSDTIAAVYGGGPGMLVWALGCLGIWAGYFMKD